jgi:hypothetical protein
LSAAAQALVRVVYDAIADIAGDLPEAHLDMIFGRIREIPLSQYTDILINFLKAFTIAAIRATQAGKKVGEGGSAASGWFGVDLLWRLIQDGVEIGNDLSELAHRIFIDLLSRPAFEPQRRVYLDKCMAGLRDDQSVVVALRVAKQIFDIYPAAYVHPLPACPPVWGSSLTCRVVRVCARWSVQSGECS